jgi:hypothetical protein
MAAQFCMKCGQPLPAGAAFCAACGTPVPGGTPVNAPTPPASAASAAPPPPPAPARPPLSSLLGLEGVRSFLLQHQLVGSGHSYRVMDHQKRHLFTARENVGQEMRANFLGQTAGGGVFSAFGSGLMPGAAMNRSFVWSLHDAGGNLQGTISIQITGGSAVSTLTDAAGAPLLGINISRGIASMTATAAYPDGRPALEAKGHLISHNFSLHDPSGAEVAKIHEAWASVRDTYNLDVAPRSDPLAPLILAIMIDREKEAR